jgi:hypothetical protein
MDRDVEVDDVEGFVFQVWARRVREGASSAGLLVLTDDDIANRLGTSKNGGLLVLERDGMTTSGWIARTLTDFSPGERKSDVLARVGEHDWTPVPLLLEKLEGARRRGEDVGAMPAARARASAEFIVRRARKRRRLAPVFGDDERRGRATGRVEEGPECDPVDWGLLRAYVSSLPVDSAPNFAP